MFFTFTFYKLQPPNILLAREISGGYQFCGCIYLFIERIHILNSRQILANSRNVLGMSLQNSNSIRSPRKMRSIYCYQYSISKFLKSEDMKWKKCNTIPSLPLNASKIVCFDAFCAVICLKGFKSEKTWRIKCKSNGEWSQESFSPCITCSDIEFVDSTITSSTKIRRNLPITRISCPLRDEKLLIANIASQLDRKSVNLRCSCKNNMNELSIRQKTCQWRFQGQLINTFMLKTIQCNSVNMNIILSDSSDFESDICKYDLF